LCEMLGYSREELRKLTWSEVTYPDDLEADLEQFNRILNGKSDDFHIDKRFICKNGEIIWTSLSARCVRFTNGNVDYFIALLFDITERKKEEDDTKKQNKELEQKIIEKNIQLQSANKESEAFNNMVSKDIKSLLKTISDLTIILKSDHESSLNDNAKKTCNNISSCAKKIEKLIDSLSIYSNISRCELNYTKIDMENLVNSVFTELTTSEDRNKIEFMVKTLPKLTGDNSTIKQSLLNLISNAIKFSSKQEHYLFQF
jgi:PAS domain S-box-containing protein